jgi:hypothetical protein
VTFRNLFASVALVALLAAAQGRAETPAAAAPAAQAGQSHDASLEEYRGHLQALAAIVEACAKARDAATCDPALIGQDDTVPLLQVAQPSPAGTSAHGGGESKQRLMSYAWLRALLAGVRTEDKAAAERAAKQAAKPAAKSPDKPIDKSAVSIEVKPADEEKDALAEDSAPPPERSTAELLQDAEARLARDLAQSNAAPAAPPPHAQERETMTQVLAEPGFRNLAELAAQETVLDKIGKWLKRWFGSVIDRIIESISRVIARSVWLGRLLLWGFILAVCVGLVWGLLQLEKGWRARLAPEGSGPAAGTASARDWQLWLEDARGAAAAGQWREAIHFVYWASISRLESRRLWPADRARTPREYLALVGPEDPRKAGLATLTGSFERIWYGGRAAAESDYRNAEQLAAGLISGSGSSVARGGAAR